LIIIFENYLFQVEFYGHEHSYERLWPIYDFKVLNGSLKEPYTNPKAPVHISKLIIAWVRLFSKQLLKDFLFFLVTGSAGCKEKREHFGPSKYFSAFRSNDYGYTRMTTHNASHLYLEQVSDDQNGEVIDRIWIIKN
jgi:hypothetical protein